MSKNESSKRFFTTNYENHEITIHSIGFLFIDVSHFCTPFEAKSDHHTYVKTVSGSTILPDAGKNHVLIRNNDDDGYIMMIAILKDNGSGRNYWTTRIIETDDNGSVNWSKDYELLTAETFETSACPFAITPNHNGDGYIIAGAWQNYTEDNIVHEGIQSPFYIEIDNIGSVNQVQRQDLDDGNIGFVPLSICLGNASNVDYMLVGVMSIDFASISSGAKEGRIARINSSLEETDSKIIKSGFVIDPNSTFDGHLSYFDAMCKIKHIPDQDDEYIISGSVTGDIAEECPTCSIYEGAGMSKAYIARIDDNLDIVWDKEWAFFSSSAEALVHASCPDFSFDPEDGQDNVLHGIINWIMSEDGNAASGYYFELDLTNGSVSSFDVIDYSHSFSSDFLTNIFVDDDNIYICGFGHGLGASGPAIGSLLPLAWIFDKSTFNQSGSYILDIDNYAFDVAQFEDCYLGIYYQNTNNTYVDLVVPSGNPINNTSQSGIPQSPLIYCPSSWIWSSENGLACSVPHKANDLCYSSLPIITGNPQFFPALFFNINSNECYFISESPGDVGDESMLTPDVDVFTGMETDEIEVTENVDDNTIVDGLYVCGEACPGSTPFQSNSSELLDQYNSMDTINFIDQIVKPNVIVRQSDLQIEIYDDLGRFIYSSKSNPNDVDLINQIAQLKSGVYIFVKISNGNNIERHKIFIP